MSREPTLVWLRQDLRLSDNPALHAATACGGAVVPVFVWAPEEDGAWPPGAASRWWLHQSLKALDRDLRRIGSRLVYRIGPSSDALLQVAAETGAKTVLWGRRYEPAVIARDAAVEVSLRGAGLVVERFNSSLLFEPWEIRTRAGKPFQVFTPFWRACRGSAPPAKPLPAPGRLPAPRRWPASVKLDALGLQPTLDWASGLRAMWKPGEAGARERMETFLAGGLASYDGDRDLPASRGSSCLSPHLHFGELSPRAIWHAVADRLASRQGRRIAAGAETFLKELGWREFAHHLLFHFPYTAESPLRPSFSAFSWRDDPVALLAWQRGRTGYPFVDAGMRQLWATGWMHNRVRMVAASFLVKHLLLPWQSGAKWFWDTLVDADLANNTLGWQWTAGCGADAAPFFRVFNPVAQGERFDASGDYVRRWVPELVRLESRWIHRPWEAPASALATAGVVLGETYPRPIVDHAAARQRALAAFAGMTGGG